MSGTPNLLAACVAVQSARPPIPRLAFTIAEAVEATSISRTLLYEDIASGLLIARKRGTKTIILTENLIAYLAALPAVREVL